MSANKEGIFCEVYLKLEYVSWVWVDVVEDTHKTKRVDVESGDRQRRERVGW